MVYSGPGEEAGDGGALEGKVENQSGGVERHSCCWGGFTQKATGGSRCSEAEVDLFLSEVGVHQKDTRRRRRKEEQEYV